MLHIIRILLLVCLFFTIEVQAGSFNYSYFQFGYLNSKIDSDANSINGNGGSLSGSFSVTQFLHALVKYEAVNFDSDIDTSTFSIGLGSHYNLSKDSDLTAAVKFVDAEFADSDDTGYELNAGLQYSKNPNYQLHADIIHVDVFKDSETSLNAGVRVKFANDKYIGFHYRNGEDSSDFGITIRMDI